MIFTIFTKSGVKIDVGKLAPDFHFLNTCTQVRLNGFFASETIFVPLDSISFMAYGDPSGMQQMIGGNAPSTEIKQ